MLGVFRRDLKKPDRLIPELPGHEYIPALKDGHLVRFFTIYENPVPVTVSLGTYGFMAYSTDKKISPSPGPMFYMKDGICCIYRGGTKMTEKSENEVDRLIACYTDIKTRNGYASPYEAMNVLCGDYNCILYDSFVGMEGAFVVNCWKAMPVYYGLDSYGFCVITDDLDIIKKVCGGSFIPISLGKGILIPVLVEIKVEAGSLDVSNQKKESAGKAIESNSSGGSNSKKTSGGEEFEDAWWQELNDF